MLKTMLQPAMALMMNIIKKIQLTIKMQTMMVIKTRPMKQTMVANIVKTKMNIVMNTMLTT